MSSMTEELIKNGSRVSRSRVDNVNHPQHYEQSCSLECIEAMEIAFGKDAVIAFCKCNAFKYLWRYKNKNGKEDIMKAKWYCDYAAKLLNENCELSDYQLDGLFKNIHSKLNFKELDFVEADISDADGE